MGNYVSKQKPPVNLDLISDKWVPPAKTLPEAAENESDAAQSIPWQEDMNKKYAAIGLQSLKDDTANRSRYISRLFAFLTIWMSVILVVVVLSGIKEPTSATSDEIKWPFRLGGLFAVAGAMAYIVLIRLLLRAWRHKELSEVPKDGVPEEIERCPRHLIYALWSVVAVFVAIASGLGYLSLRHGGHKGWPLYEWIVAFELSDPVLLTLIGATTANVIGIWLVVANYLYPKRPGDLDRD